MKTGVSGLTIVRNAVRLGYPLYYSVKSLIDACDEFVISEGFSEDSTMDIVRQLKEEYPEKLRVIHEVWKPSRWGETIAKVTNIALEHCRYQWIYYIQADEFVHEDNLQFIASVPRRHPHYRAISFRFVHFIPNLLTVARGGYTHATRMVRNYPGLRRRLRIEWEKTRLRSFVRRKLRPLEDLLLPFLDAFAVGDAWTLYGNVRPVLEADFLKPVFHVGYVERNRTVLASKLESHGKMLYASMPIYKKEAAAVREGNFQEFWRERGTKFTPYRGQDYPKLLLAWAEKEGIEYLRDRESHSAR